jgi:hypothetical protein
MISFPQMITRARRTLLGCIAAVLCLHPCHARAATAPDQQFAEAQEAFEKGDYRRARTLAESIISDGNVSPTLFQFLGNTRYREGDLGRAALWYQRAALFPPPSAETRQNLAHVHDRTGNLSFPGNSFGDQIIAYLTRSQWLAIAVFCGWTWAIFHLIAYLMVRAGELRVFLVTVAMLALLCGIGSGLCWYNHPSYGKLRDLAIVTAPNAAAYTGASVTSGSVINLPPGSEVRKLDDRDKWVYVEIPGSQGGDSKRGWVQSDTLSPFWPFDPGYLE